MTFNTKWDFRFLDLAKLVASWSKDPSTKTGAVIVDQDKKIVSLGYNGFPIGVKDDESKLNDRDLKYQMVVHCERNAMIFAKRDLTNCIIYTYPFMPCSVCAGMIIQFGIKRVVAPKTENPRWIQNFALSLQMLTEAGLVVDIISDYAV